MPKVVILGAGGHARETLGIFEELKAAGPGAGAGAGEWDVLGFVDEDPAKHGALVDGKAVLGDFSWFTDQDAVGAPPGDASDLRVICAVGADPGGGAREPGARNGPGLLQRRLAAGVRVPAGQRWRGSMIAPGAIIGPEVTVGDHVIVNVGCTISHEARLGDYCTLAPGVHIAGNTRLGDGCDLGIGTVTIQAHHW